MFIRILIILVILIDILCSIKMLAMTQTHYFLLIIKSYIQAFTMLLDLLLTVVNNKYLLMASIRQFQ